MWTFQETSKNKVFNGWCPESQAGRGTTKTILPSREAPACLSRFYGMAGKLQFGSSRREKNGHEE
jgi:hypothetical protein